MTTSGDPNQPHEPEREPGGYGEADQGTSRYPTPGGGGPQEGPGGPAYGQGGSTYGQGGSEQAPGGPAYGQGDQEQGAGGPGYGQSGSTYGQGGPDQGSGGSGYGPGGYGPGPPPMFSSGGGPSGRPGGDGLATAALVLGILSLFLLVVCGVGVLLALVGLILGIVAVTRGGGRGRAVAGIVLSVLTLLLALLFVLWLTNSGITDCFDPDRYPSQSAVQDCLEREYGVTWR